MIIPNSRVYFGDCKTFDGRDMGVIKIGLSHDPESRVKAVTATDPFICELVCSTPGDMFLEYFCHMWLRKYRVAGEFFRKSQEVLSVMNHVQRKGRLPFPIKFVGKEGMFIHLDVAGYMERNGITLSDIEQATGVCTKTYEKALEKSRCGNRRLLAAVAVTAVRKGLTVHWARDFKPVETDQAAA